MKKIRFIMCLSAILLLLGSCSSQRYHWYTTPDATVKLSLSGERVVRMLVILNYSGTSEIKKLESEKALLIEQLGIRDYFEYSRNKSDFLLVHYTGGADHAVGFYNFNFQSKDFNMSDEKVLTILKHFGLMEAADEKRHRISYSQLLESEEFIFRFILTEGTKQILKEPNWFDERFAE